jgi:class 3 adenylate cyclase
VNKEATTKVNLIVVVVDVCSSTTILQNLSNSGRLSAWGELLSDLGSFLDQEQLDLGFEIYKFTGDGWIFFFDPTLPTDHFVPFLHRLSDQYKASFELRLRSELSVEIDVGLAFGVDKVGLGNHTMIPLTLHKKAEYVGMPVNMAARLQAAIKDNDKPEGRVLMSAPAYKHLKYGIPQRKYRIVKVERKLHNVLPIPNPIKLYLYEGPRPQELTKNSNLLSVSPSPSS